MTQQQSSNYIELLHSITEDVIKHPRDLASYIGKRFNVSRVTANKYIQKFEKDGWIARSGASTHPIFSLGYQRQISKIYPLADLLAQYGGEQLVSRSQAKRLIARFDNFKTVILDFADVPEIGQAFSDEVFRVYVRAHPDVEIVPINMTAQVEGMYRRVQTVNHTPA